MPIWEKRKNICLMKRGGSMTPAVAWSVVALFVFAFRLASLKKFATCAALFALGFVDALTPWTRPGGFARPGIKKTGPRALDKKKAPRGACFYVIISIPGISFFIAWMRSSAYLPSLVIHPLTVHLLCVLMLDSSFAICFFSAAICFFISFAVVSML